MKKMKISPHTPTVRAFLLLRFNFGIKEQGWGLMRLTISHLLLICHLRVRCRFLFGSLSINLYKPNKLRLFRELYVSGRSKQKFSCASFVHKLSNLINNYLI